MNIYISVNDDQLTIITIYIFLTGLVRVYVRNSASGSMNTGSSKKHLLVSCEPRRQAGGSRQAALVAAVGFQMDVRVCEARAQRNLCASHRTMFQNDSAMLLG